MRYKLKRIIDKNDSSQENNFPGELYVQALIRAARSTDTQQDFALRLNTTQNLLSKYESGGIKNPPSNIIGKCLASILHKHNDKNIDQIGPADLASYILETLSGAEQANIRKLIYDLVSELK
jgi:transcriptional regulator with XRE-family HTH domain